MITWCGLERGGGEPSSDVRQSTRSSYTHHYRSTSVLAQLDKYLGWSRQICYYWGTSFCRAGQIFCQGSCHGSQNMSKRGTIGWLGGFKSGCFMILNVVIYKSSKNSAHVAFMNRLQNRASGKVNGVRYEKRSLNSIETALFSKENIDEKPEHKERPSAFHLKRAPPIFRWGCGFLTNTCEHLGGGRGAHVVKRGLAR